ncbi:MAG TPA: hypothetical protein VEX88_07905, partial [Glaciibacter sp.]|nr:hypothetical protein [Glaciibacter sp.]
MGFLAMAAAGLITVTYSVPATAVGIEDGATVSVVASSTPHVTAANVQVLEAGTATQGAISRDGFTVTVPPPPPPPPPARIQAAATPRYSGAAIQWPVPSSSRVSGDYGPRIAPCAGCSTFHKGADLTPGLGTPITSIASGVVT